MTRRIEIRPAAQDDLLDIGQYSEDRWGRERARSYLRAIAQTLDRVAANPSIDSDQSHLAPGYRKARSGSHNLYYRFDDRRVILVRVLHAKMDVARIDWPTD